MKAKDPAAVSLGRKGGEAGKGAAKRRPSAHYRKMQKKSVEARAKRHRPVELPLPEATLEGLGKGAHGALLSV